ncbi:hypothetical protein GPJ56_010321 [Histomonas meleagridis]|uniref:uncharacterized protein n=1 Tax=Histomonas meleagridis TaxID=135588 RepID=UPI003559FD44|nr:hypothetical protein GPJ56_010318 [Histomonas meleagridis]KAH0785759.1 hypothetical protein GPJ56_010321 [Histomonas meleagridis]KAH0797925.1 hypothetical protein GO595_009554 [Histomonas meleagridis]KAH0797928.1 hypothetical protein GO595_009557 [Histomonas meleagridis]
MSAVDQTTNQDNTETTHGQYRLAGNVEGNSTQREVHKLKLILEASDEECRKALEIADNNLNNAAVLLLEKDVNEIKKNEPKKKIKISEEIQREFGGTLSFFEISQVLVMYDGNEAEAIKVLRTMV